MEKLKNIFIDTNIYLEYFEMSSATGTSLKELLGLLQGGSLRLILPKQVNDEYWRKNKKRMIEEMRNKISEQVPGDLKIPPPVKDLSEAKKLRKNYTKFKESFGILLKRYDKEFKKRSRVERLIERIFKNAKFVEEEGEIIQRAYYQYLKGNPPGKKNKYGDAIIWETLLAKFSKNDLTIITEDPDWCNSKRKECLNDFLIKEWRGKTRRKLAFYSSLAEFINQFTGKKIIKKEVIQEEKATKDYLTQVRPVRDFGLMDTATRVSDWASSTRVFNDPDYYSAASVFYPKEYFCPFCGEKFTSSLADVSTFVFYENRLECPRCHRHFYIRQ